MPGGAVASHVHREDGSRDVVFMREELTGHFIEVDLAPVVLAVFVLQPPRGRIANSANPATYVS
jgi:hypothetical protein